MSSPIHSRSLSQSGIAIRYDLRPLGTNEMYVSSRRANLTSGFS